MMEAATSMNAKNYRASKRLLSMRFSGLAAGLDYLSQAKLVCSSCGKRFGRRSTMTLMNRGDSWELMLPHDCVPSSPSIEESSSKPEART